jgi:hypothetical protein
LLFPDRDGKVRPRALLSQGNDLDAIVMKYMHYTSSVYTLGACDARRISRNEAFSNTVTRALVKTWNSEGWYDKPALCDGAALVRIKTD